MIKNKTPISNKKQGILIVLVVISLIFHFGCDKNKCPVCPENPYIVVSDDINDIQQAIDSLPEDGGTVYIKAGTYILSQGIHINRSDITITGEEGTLIKLDDDVNQPVFLLGSDAENPTTSVENIQIENIEIDGNKDNQTSETDPDRPWIRNNGIDVRMVNGLWVSNVDIHHTRSGGIVVAWKSKIIFVENSYFHHNYYDGIALYDSEDIMISNFICYENNAAGLSLDVKLKHTSFNNGLIKNQGDVGIFVRDSEDISFHDLVIYNSGDHGCFLSHVEIGSNTGVKRLLFAGCSFLDNNGCGLYLASPKSESPNVSVIGCLFSGNTQAAICIDPNGELYQEGNIFQ